MGKGSRGSESDDREVGERPDNKQEDSDNGRIRISKYEDIQLDQWQQEALEYEGNMAIRAGRQVGKSTVISIKAAKHALFNKNQSIMIISATERQAYLLFSKVLMYINDNYKWAIKQGKDRPTKTEIKLKNGSIIRCLPTGLDGLGIRGYTIHLLIADEAAFIPQDVWPAVTPMIATTGGKIILLSTPYGKHGYFYERFFDDNFKKWHISSEEVAEQRDEPQRTFMREFQEEEKKRMSKLQYAQEYMGEFVDDLRQLYSDELVKAVCIGKRTQIYPKFEYFLGVDIARLGDDKTTFEVVERRLDLQNNVHFIHSESIIYEKKLTTDTFDKILDLNSLYNFKKIGIDAGSGSLGVGILDFLLREPDVKRKVVALNNLTRELDHYGERKRTLLKEDMYMNLLAMMERRNITLLDDDEVIASLRGIQYEYVITASKKSSIKIFAAKHEHTDLVEGLIRAAWLANAKSINKFISYI
jgi:hypothetical protein